MRHIGRVSAPVVFDRSLARRQLRRALAGGYADFLLRRAVDDLDDRLGAVLRRFPLALDLGTPTGAAVARLVSSERCHRVVRLAPATEAAAGLSVVGDEEALPFRDESFDLAVSLLALHGVNDLPGALVQVRRALRPDGLFLACVLGGATLTELRQAFAAAEAEIEGGVSPRVAPFADVRDFGALLQRAAALYAERFADGDGRVRATFEIVWLSGWAPHESQPKPLRPGSARTRLADALGVAEHRLGEKAGG